MAIFKFNWRRVKAIIKGLILLTASITFFVATISFFGRNGLKEATVALVLSGITLGLLIGSYISAIFLRQEKKSQVSLLVFLPILSLISFLFVTALISGTRNITLFKVLVIFCLLILATFPLGLFISFLFNKLKQQVAAAETAAAHSKSELQLLQSQLSPHFLFNTLNNLYGIALSEPEKTPGMLLKLSELLRYSVYDAKDTFVPLKDELNYLNNYIEFEKIRIGERLDLKVEMENINTNNVMIAPMLLVVFVENAFKHAKNSLSQNIQIEISMKIWINQILFAVKNSHKDTGSSEGVNKHSGFGLQSTIKRLELLYPNAHDMKIEKDEDSFAVMLRVNIKRGSKK